MIVYRIIRATSPLSFAISSSTTCNDVHDCRTVPSIGFNCASTIFLCTWVALHLDVPEDPWEALWKSVLRRVGWTMMALLAPEAVLLMAFLDWIGSSNDLNNKLSEFGNAFIYIVDAHHLLLMTDRDPTCDWTETHAMLARMRGLRVEAEDGSWRVREYIGGITSDVRMPTMREIQDRSKGDAVAKAITIVQTLWFAIQAAHRISQGLVVTELELTTLGHVVLNIFVYWCWWNKPLNLQFPVDVYRAGDRGEAPNGELHPLEIESQGPALRRKLPIRVRMGTYFARNFSDLDWKGVVVLICFSIIGGIFGAIHCLAWNSTFPTNAEHLLWRVSALVVTAFPGLGFAVFVFGDQETSGRMEGSLKAAAWFLAVVYCLGRVCLLALGLAALRALPESAYEVPSWTVYIPHIG